MPEGKRIVKRTTITEELIDAPDEMIEDGEDDEGLEDVEDEAPAYGSRKDRSKSRGRH